MKKCDKFEVCLLTKPRKFTLQTLNSKIDFDLFNNSELCFKIEKVVNYNIITYDIVKLKEETILIKLNTEDVLEHKHPRYKSGIIYTISDNYSLFITSDGEEFIIDNNTYLVVKNEV